LDFSLIGLRFLNLKSDEFNQIISNAESKQLRIKNTVEEYLKENGDSDNMFALIPEDFTNSCSEEKFWMVINILLVIFPSSITLHYLIDIDKIDGDKIYTHSQSHFNFNPNWKEDFYDDYLQFDDDEVSSVN